jgi:hypothetical protein
MTRKQIIDGIPEDIENVEEYIKKLLDDFERDANSIRDYIADFKLDNLSVIEDAMKVAEKLSDDLY